MIGHLFAATVYGREVPSAMLGPAPQLQELALQRLASPDYRGLIEQVLGELGRRGNAVIVGHAAQIVLQQPGTLKVLVRGTLPKRCERLASERGTEPAEAAEIIANLDDLRNKFFHQAYGVDWLDSSLYDITLKTDGISERQAVAMIVAAAQHASHTGGGPSGRVPNTQARQAQHD